VKKNGKAWIDPHGNLLGKGDAAYYFICSCSSL